MPMPAKPASNSAHQLSFSLRPPIAVITVPMPSASANAPNSSMNVARETPGRVNSTMPNAIQMTPRSSVIHQ